jgi:hypothetical protein
MIAIVDDDESVREATKSLVRSLGYEAATFGSAEEFLGSSQLKDHSLPDHRRADAWYERDRAAGSLDCRWPQLAYGIHFRLFGRDSATKGA